MKGNNGMYKEIFVFLTLFTLVLAGCAPATPISPAAPPAALPTSVPTAALPNTGSSAAIMPVVSAANKGMLGNILTDSKGMTLYVFLKDSPGMSNCYDKCAANWPAAIVQKGASLTAASGVSAKLGTTTRKDGSVQLTVNDMPVYTFIKDKTTQDIFGQGVGQSWYVLDTSGNQVKTQLPAQGTPTSQAQAPVIKVSQNATLGKFLTDSRGLTLYAFLNDKPGVSNCYDQCAASWPAYTIPQGVTPAADPAFTGKLGTITRKDGSIQLTVNDMPVYFWIGDKNPGDTNGQGIGKVWFILDQTGNLNKAGVMGVSTSSSSSSSSSSGGSGW